MSRAQTCHFFNKSINYTKAVPIEDSLKSSKLSPLETKRTVEINS